MLYPDEPEVGVGAVVLDNMNRILLIKRKNPPGAGKWSVPGGHLTLGESIYNAALRELHEETGIEGIPRGIINIDELVEFDKEGKVRYHYVLIDVLIEPKSPLENAKASSDAEEVGIFNVREAINLKLTKSTRSLIEKIISKSFPILHSNFITYTI